MDAKAAILALFFDVQFEAGEQFDAREDETIGLRIESDGFDEDAVQAITQADVGLLRLQVYVGGITASAPANMVSRMRDMR